MGGVRSQYEVWVGKRERKIPLEKYEDNIKTNLKEIEREAVDWIRMSQVRNQWRTLVNKIMKL
jgi:hypothetical protein